MQSIFLLTAFLFVSNHFTYFIEKLYSLVVYLIDMQDNMKLMDDLAALRPTIFCSVPRLYNRIYAGYFGGKVLINMVLQSFYCDLWLSTWFAYFRITNAVKNSGALKERLFNAAYHSKKQAIMNGVFCSILN